MRKIIHLSKIHIYSFFHKLRHDLAKEIVIGVCGIILMGLFYYVFNDFLNIQIMRISPGMKLRFAQFLASVLVLASSLFAGRLLSSYFHSSQSLHKTMSIIGENPKVIRFLTILHCGLVLASVYIPMWLVINKVLMQVSLIKILGISLCMMFLSLSLRFLAPQSGPKKRRPFESHSHRGQLFILVQWKWRILLRRNRPARFCLFLYALSNLLLWVSSYFEFPYLSAYALSFGAASMGACALCFQFAEDLQSSRLEKSSGLSHHRYLTALFILSFIIGSLLGLANFIPWFFVNTLKLSLNLNTFLDALRLFFITAIPSWTVPCVLFQIDGRRPILTLLVSFLISLFLTTAVFASWFALALLPLVVYYGYTSQEGRFYRS